MQGLVITLVVTYTPARFTVADLARLLLLQALFAAHRLWSLPGSPSLLFIVPMAEVLVIAGAFRLGEGFRAARKWEGGRSLSSALHALLLSPVMAALLVFNGGEIFYRQFYLQHFNPFTDLALIPGFARMLFPSIDVPDGVLGIVSVAVSSVVLCAFAFGLILALARIGARRPVTHPLVLGAAMMATGAVLLLVMPEQSPFMRMASDARVYAAPAGESPVEESAAAVVESTPSQGNDSDLRGKSAWAFPGIKDADIHVIVLESYGATLVERPDYLEAIRKVYTELDREMDAAGYVVLSGTVRSPAFGGRSWLADGTLLSGNNFMDQLAYDRFTEEGRPAKMLELMGKAGYRRIYAAPGTRNAPEAWKLAYPFEEYLLRYDFGYEGPFVSFGAMPDQYLLDRVAGNSLRPGVKDFALYLLVSSHVPFEVIPEYQDAWSFPLRGKEFETGLLQHFDNDWLGGSELAEGYLAGIEYSLRSASGLFTRKLKGLNVGLILGDHQPRKPVSHASADFQVPFHLVIPRSLYSKTMVAMLAGWNLRPGFEPTPDPEAPGMESLNELLQAVLYPGD